MPQEPRVYDEEFYNVPYILANIGPIGVIEVEGGPDDGRLGVLLHFKVLTEEGESPLIICIPSEQAISLSEMLASAVTEAKEKVESRHSGDSSAKDSEA